VKKYLLVLPLLLFLSVANAQTDSIQNEILNVENTKYEIAQKARRLIVEKLDKGEIDKIGAIKSYLAESFGNNALIFGMREYWLILFWTQDFEELLSSIENIGFERNANAMSLNNSQLGFFNDNLQEKLIEKSISTKEMIEVTINMAQLNQEEKDFLQLHLNYCLADVNNDASAQENLNNQADKFLINYPSSIYGPFIRKVIRFKQTVSDFGWGYDLFVGYHVFNGGIAESFSDYFSFGMSVDMAYKSYLLNLSFSLGRSTLQKDIDYQSIIWDEGRRGDIFVPQASFGYTFFAQRRLSITPFVGVSGFYIMPEYDDIQAYTPFENIELNSDASWNAGLSINLFSKPATGGNMIYRASQFQAFIKLKYNYFHSGYKKEYYGLDGAMHQISLSFGGFVRRIKRTY